MAKGNQSHQPSKRIRDEAADYVDNLPDETAEGRLVTDKGMPADTDAFRAAESRQKGALKTGKPTGTTDTGTATSMKDKRGNKGR